MTSTCDNYIGKISDIEKTINYFTNKSLHLFAIIAYLNKIDEINTYILSSHSSTISSPNDNPFHISFTMLIINEDLQS